MTYRLGVDLGTTYSSAAVASGGKARIVALGNRSAVVPSVVFSRDGGSLLTGEAADRRGMAEAGRVAREFKRRFGDPNPFRLGDTLLRADQLMAAMLPPILAATEEKEGGAPDRLALTHPANWGQAKRTMLREAVSALDLQLPPTMLVTEPEAAAIYYAETEHLDVGEVVAVYDLGGGTFDTAILRRTATGFDLMGPPEGIDRLGGVDFDAAVYAHVNRFLDGALDQYDMRDPTAAAGLARLRADCVEAKEALSADTDVSIPVLLPGLRTELRMTRSELESMIRPALGDTVGALRRAMRAAHVSASDVKVVLLVGGSSRIPLVAQTVGAEIGRPVAIDVHPKHAVALGAALAADASSDAVRAAGADRPVGTADAGSGPTAGSAAPATSDPQAAPATSDPQAAPATSDPQAAPAAAVATQPAAGPAGTPTAAVAAPGAAAGTGPAARPTAGSPAAAPAARPGGATSAAAPVGPPPAPAGGRIGPRPPEDAARSTTQEADVTGGGRRSGLIAALVVLVVVVGGVAALLLGGGGGAEDTATGVDPTAVGKVQASTTAPTTATSGPVPTSPTSTADPAAPPTVTVPPDPPTPAECVDQEGPFVCIYGVGRDERGNLIVPFETFGYTPDKGRGRHIHFFLTAYPEIAVDHLNAGNSGPDPQGNWVLWDEPNPFGLLGGTDNEHPPGYTVDDVRTLLQQTGAASTQICVLVASDRHAVTLNTGNCLDIPPEVLA